MSTKRRRKNTDSPYPPRGALLHNPIVFQHRLGFCNTLPPVPVPSSLLPRDPEHPVARRVPLMRRLCPPAP